jgi:hypothetical protein
MISEDLESTVEDNILERLYQEYDEETVDKFLKDYEGNLVTNEISRHISSISDCIDDKVSELCDLLYTFEPDETDDYDEVPF